MSSSSPTATLRARRWLAIGAVGLLLGIAVTATDKHIIGAWLTVLSMLALGVGLHTFGRLGPDGPSDSLPEPSKKPSEPPSA